MKPNYVSAAEAAKLIKSYDRVYIQGSTSIPEVLLDAITARASELKGRHRAFECASGASPR